VLVGLYDPATLERLEAVGPEGLVLSEAEGPVPEGAVTLIELRMEDGEWRMENGQWRIENGE